MSKRHHFDHDQVGGPVSSATRDDLAGALADLAESQRLASRAAVKLARVRARGDGEAAVGMSVEQHLRWNTNARRGLVTSLGVLTDVAGELPTLMAALNAGAVNLDQAFAVAWPAAKVSRDLRRSLDLSLATDAEGWTERSPESLQAEVERLVEDLRPARTEQQELERAQRQFLHVQPTLDGQGLRGWFNAWGVDAALIDQTLRAASDRPAADDPDPDGPIVGRPTRRAGQLFDGLLRIFRGWASGGTDVDKPAAPPVTIYAIVDQTADGSGSGELLTARRGLAPRLSAAAVARLEAEGARRVEVFAVGREIVAVRGRTGHAITDPGSLSEQTTRIICRVRDATCRMPGCDRPVEHLHHLVWRGLAKARGEISPDDPGHRVGLCTPCHQLVHRWRWAGTVGAPTDRTAGRITWSRTGPTGRTTVSTIGRLSARLQRPPPEPAIDQFGDPLPF